MLGRSFEFVVPNSKEKMLVVLFFQLTKKRNLFFLQIQFFQPVGQENVLESLMLMSQILAMIKFKVLDL
jgi:hypothetical protein